MVSIENQIRNILLEKGIAVVLYGSENGGISPGLAWDITKRLGCSAQYADNPERFIFRSIPDESKNVGIINSLEATN